MGILTPATRHKNHRSPIEMINYAVWRYFRFWLSLRDGEALLFERGAVVTYETIPNGVVRLANNTPTNCVAAVLGPAINGTSMRRF
jgi:transposase-like protein